MPSPTAIADTFGVWYQLGSVSIVPPRLWKQAQHSAISPVLRLSVPGLAPLNFNSFIYVRARYEAAGYDGRRVIERSTRYYPDADATIIRIDPAFRADRRDDWNFAASFHFWIELMAIPAYSGAIVPPYSIKIEELHDALRDFY